MSALFKIFEPALAEFRPLLESIYDSFMRLEGSINGLHEKLDALERELKVRSLPVKSSSSDDSEEKTV